MSKFYGVLFLTLFLFSSTIFAQNRSILIYTLQSEAEFVPFIDGKQMTMIPVDSFFIYADTLQFVHIDIHFLDDKTANLSKNVSFEFFKHKKYEIVFKSSFSRSINDLGNGLSSDTLYDKFKLKNHSAMNYFSKESSID